MKNQFDEKNPEHWWNVWFLKTYNRSADGFIIHAFFEGNYITACGRDTNNAWIDTGMLNMKDTEPSCIKCKKKLKSLGVLK